MTSILQRIAEHKTQEVSAAKKKMPLSTLRDQPLGEQRDFISALKPNTSPAIIAEIKKASPSKGVIRKEFNVT